MTVPRMTGPSLRKVQVQTNDRAAVTTFLECTAHVSVADRLSMPNVNFGQLKRNSEAQTRTITITRGDGGPLKPKLLPGTANKAVAADLKEVREGEEYELTVTVSPPWPNDMIHGSLTLETGIEQAPQEMIPVVAQVTPRLATNPPRFTIPQTVESDLDLSAQLTWSDEKSGKVTAVTVTDPKLTAELVDRDDQQAVVLHVPAGYAPSTGAPGFVRLTTDDADVPMMQIPVYAMRSPVATPTPTSNPVVRPGMPPTPVMNRVAPGMPPATVGKQ
jgi:hypothetical protein